MQQDVSPEHEEGAQEGSPPALNGFIDNCPQQAEPRDEPHGRHQGHSEEAPEQKHRELHARESQSYILTLG